MKLENNLNIYFFFFRREDANKDTIKQFTSIKKISNSFNKDPLYIINLDNFKDEIDLISIRKKYPNSEFHLAENDWLPERIKCQRTDNTNKLNGTLKEFYHYDKVQSEYYLLKNIHYSDSAIKKAQSILQTKFDLWEKLKAFLTNNSGMYFLSEPYNSKKLDQHIDQITTHFSKIKFLHLGQSDFSNFYKSTFNRLDYGVSIVSMDRTIIYANKVRRINFGNQIIGKKCYDVFVLDKTGLCKGCLMGKNHLDLFETDMEVIIGEIHKLKDKNNRVYFISESTSKLELINCTKTSIPTIEKFGINVVRDNSSKTIANEFQKIIQKLNSYHDIIDVLKFAIIGGERKHLLSRLIRNKKTNSGLTDDIIRIFLDRLTYRESTGKEMILNFGYNRMRFFRNHINIFQKDFDKIKDPYDGDVLQVFASYSHEPTRINNKDISDQDIKGMFIDFKIAKDCIINELKFNRNGQLIENQLNTKNDIANKFLKEIGIENAENKGWYDIKMVANNRLLGYLTIDGKEKRIHEKKTVETLQYLIELVNNAAQAIQRSIDHKEMMITREIAFVINENYDNPNDLNSSISKILCEKLETLKCEIFSITNNNIIYRDFLYYHNLNTSQNKRLYQHLHKTKITHPNIYIIGKNLLGNVLSLIKKDIIADNFSKEYIYNKCISVLNYDMYNHFYKGIKGKQLNEDNQKSEENIVKHFSINNAKPNLQNCIIAPLLHNNDIMGAIKLTNNGNTGKIFFPIHEQRILYYVAEQLAIKTINFRLIKRELAIDKIFNHFSALQIESEKYEFNMLDNWRNDISGLDNNIRNKIIFNNKILVNLVNADALFYYGFDNINNKFIKVGKRLKDMNVRFDIWTKFMTEYDNPLKYVTKVKNEGGESIVFIKNKQATFSKIIFTENDNRILCFPIFVENEVFSLLILQKFNDSFSDEDFQVINTISNQIAGVLQIAAFKRKGSEIMQNISHQIIAPLSGFDAYMSQLIRNMLPKEDSKYYEFKDLKKKEFVLHSLQSQASHVRNIAKSIKYFTDMGVGKSSSITKTTFNLTAELIKIAALYQPMAKGQGINSIIVKNKENLPIYSDQILLFHIGVCLIDNAIKYSDKGSNIFIEICFVDNRKYVINFVNFGLIIPKINYVRIFNREFRSPNAEKRNPHGSGIGLSLVKQFSLLLGGDCYVKNSDRKHGTTITVEILKVL